MNANALFHPCLLYGHCSDWNKQKHYEKPIFVYKDCSDKCAKCFQKQDEDINRIKNAILKQFPEVNLDAVYPFKKWVDSTYGSMVQDKSSLKTSISSNIGLKSIKAPMNEIGKNKFVPDFQHRYFREDIPTGLLSIKDLGQLAGVKTPFIDSIMKWQQVYTGQKLIEGDKIAQDDAKKNQRVSSLYEVKSLKEYIRLSL